MWFLRMKRWVQNPPPMKRVIFVLAIIAVCLVLVLIEHLFGWPDALSVNPARRGPWR